MPSSKLPKKSTDGAHADADAVATAPGAPKPNPSWWAPVMVGLMVVGLLWVVVYYLTGYTYPVESWGNWNLGAGFGFMLVGFLMTTNWR